MTNGYEEQVVLFGQEKALVGVLTRPKVEPRRCLPAVVILNTGIIHRVGHHRMYVDLARQLAMAGHAVVRFDFSGIGDSPRRADGLGLIDGCLADIRDAVEWLTTTTRAEGIVLVGLCSGADIALRYGHTDRRIVGLMLLDPPIPATTRFYAHYVFRRITRLRSWLSFIRGRGRIWSDLALGVVSGPRRADENANLIKEYGRDELERLYRRTLERDIQLFVALTGGEAADRQTYREQLLDAFPNVPFGSRLRLEFFAEADHTFTSRSDRERLNVMAKAWLDATPFRQVSG